MAIVIFLSAMALAQTAPSIPDLKTLLNEVQANQHKMDDVRENYTFHRIRTEEDLDDKGAVVKTTSQEREVFFVNGRQIARLVKKDGKPLNAQEEKNEQARVTNMVKMAMKSDGKVRRGRGNISMISEILPMVKVASPRRISFHGRSTLVFDFTGDPQAKAKDTNENVAKKMAGTIWFDEADRQVARMEVHLYDNFRMGGGFLASVKRGSTIEVEQSPIGDGLWMQTSNDQRFDLQEVQRGRTGENRSTC